MPDYRMQTTSEILSRYGVSSRITSTIEPHRGKQGQWRIKFSGAGAPCVLMDIGGASRLAIELRQIAETDLADRLDEVLAITRGYARRPQF
jgi:hypothetical protein